MVIPTFNRAHLIAQTLESVARQSLLPDEIVVIDDGSTDDNLTVIEDWNQANPQVQLSCLRQENLGANAARNRGIKEAAGEFIAFLDSRM